MVKYYVERLRYKFKFEIEKEVGGAMIVQAIGEL